MNHKTIYVKTTGTCNLDCSHCFTNGKTGDKTQFDPGNTALWVQDFITTHGPDNHYHLEFHGGEPFLTPLWKLEQMAEAFVGRDNVSMCANSNLTFRITDDLIEFIKKYFHSNIGTSWDHWIRWTTDKQRALWKSNLELLSSHDIHIGLKVSVSKQLVDHSVDWFLDQMESFAVDEVSLERLTMDGNALQNTDVFPDNEAQDNWYLELYKRYKARNGRVKISTLDTIEAKLKYGMVKVDTNCRNCEQNLVTINSDGSLGGCPNVATARNHAHLNDGVQEFLISNGRLNEIATELTWPDECIGCDVFDLCGGDCHRLPWKDGRCGGLKNTLRHMSGRSTDTNLILRVK